MIDIENYKRAIAWLRRGLNELQQDPDNNGIQLSILHQFEVTHNISEALLREAYVLLGTDEQAPYVSLRALLSRAAEDGIRLSSPTQWLQYALVLETAKQMWFDTATADFESILPLLPRFADELDAFAQSVQQRLAPLA